MIYFIHVCSLNIGIGAFITSEDGNTVNITDSIISNCYSSTSGAITIYQNEMNIRNTQFIANEAGSSAGAMYIARDSFVTIEDCEFLDNSVADYAGAIYIGDNNDITISNNTFEDNMADVGGAIVMLAGIGTEEENTVNIDIENTQFIDNVAISNGGAFYAKRVSSTLEDAETFSHTIKFGKISIISYLFFTQHQHI